MPNWKSHVTVKKIYKYVKPRVSGGKRYIVLEQSSASVLCGGVALLGLILYTGLGTISRLTLDKIE